MSLLIWFLRNISTPINESQDVLKEEGHRYYSLTEPTHGQTAVRSVSHVQKDNGSHGYDFISIFATL